MKYLRFSIMPFLLLLSIISLLMGPVFIIIYFILLDSLFILGDYFLPQDTQKPNYSKPQILNFLLYINLPLLIILYFFLGWYSSSIDVFGLGLWLNSTFSINIIEHKANMQFYHYLDVKNELCEKFTQPVKNKGQISSYNSTVLKVLMINCMSKKFLKFYEWL